MTPYVGLHGFTGQPDSWSEVMDLLGQGTAAVRCLCPSLLGHGMSPPATLAAAFEDEVDRLAAIVEAAGMAGSHLLGYSMGGRLALGLLLRYGSLFRSATLVGVHGGIRDDGARRQRRQVDEARARDLETGGLESFLDHWENLPLFASQQHLPEEVRQCQRRQRRRHRAEGLAAALRILGPANMPDYHDQLTGLDLPVTLVVGEYDEKFLGLAKPLLRALPRGRLEVVPEVGHNVVLEAPAAVARCSRHG